MADREHLAKRYAPGIVVYNTNNYTKGIVIDGGIDKDNDPSSQILEFGYKGLFINCPPNRALIPTGEYFDLNGIKELLKVRRPENDNKGKGKPV